MEGSEASVVRPKGVKAPIREQLSKIIYKSQLEQFRKSISLLNTKFSVTPMTLWIVNVDLIEGYVKVTSNDQWFLHFESPYAFTYQGVSLKTFLHHFSRVS